MMRNKKEVVRGKGYKKELEGKITDKVKEVEAYFISRLKKVNNLDSTVYAENDFTVKILLVKRENEKALVNIIVNIKPRIFNRDELYFISKKLVRNRIDNIEPLSIKIPKGYFGVFRPITNPAIMYSKYLNII